MSPSIEEQIIGLKRTIAEIESQRKALGDETVDAALMPIQRKLNELTSLLAAQEDTSAAQPAQQRKLVTLLFMDIAGSTSIAQHMDPEDVREAFDSTLKRLAAPIEEHGGRVTRFMGDGFLSVFGAPTAREDDPERAIRAGLKIIELSGELAPELREDWGVDAFQVRIGLNTGLVALGGLTEAEDTLMGAAVNLAARLESAAPPGGLLISHDTYRHVRGVFDVELLEPIQVKGFDELVKVYRVLRAKARAFRTYTRGVEGVETRMVGREAELKYLKDALLTAIEENEGQLVTISGEAGVGKSRLLYEFQDWIELLPPPVVRFFEGRAYPEAQGIPYGLLRDLFVFRFQIQDDDSVEVAREKIRKGFLETFGDESEGEMRTHILGQLLGFDFSASLHLKGVLGDAEQLRNRGLMYLVEYFRGLCDQGPVVVILEDIHWADDSSLDALGWLGERLHRQRLLIVCAARPLLFERRPYWGEGLAYHQRIDMLPLSRRESRALVAEILKLATDIPIELRDLLVEGAEGNPFYVEELVKMLVEGGAIITDEEAWCIEPERLSRIQVPPTLAGVLQARLDTLSIEERTILQQASVVGRLFWDRVVAHIQTVRGGKPQVVPEALTSLRGREMVYRREKSTFMDAREYIFKHDILREVTYESVLKRLRRIYHGLVAEWLIAQGAGRVGEFDTIIANHLLQADRTEQATQYLIQAGNAALASYANGEAETQFRKALELSSSVTQRAACLAGLGETLGRQGRKDEAERIQRQAIDLYDQIGEYERVAALYTRLSQFLWFGDYQRAWAVCHEGLRRLEGVPESPGLAYLLAEAGRTAYFRAQSSEEVITLCERAIEMAERLTIIEPKADASITLAFVQNDLLEAINKAQEAAVLSEANGLPQAAARAHHNIGFIYWVSLSEAEQSYKQFMRSAGINRQMGNVDSMIWDLWNSVILGNFLGYQETILDSVADFLHRSSATETQARAVLQSAHAYTSHYRGDWKHLLEYLRAELYELRKGGSLQLIAFQNLGLISSILELHRFAGQDNLPEAEAALLENINLGWLVEESHLILAVRSARTGNFRNAYEHLAEVQKVVPQNLTKLQQSYLLQAKIELGLAERHWEEAITACQSLIDIYQSGGYLWQWARILIDLGDTLLGRDAPSDRELAQAAYQESLEMFTEMNATGYMRVLEERLGEL